MLCRSQPTIRLTRREARVVDIRCSWLGTICDSKQAGARPMNWLCQWAGALKSGGDKSEFSLASSTRPSPGRKGSGTRLCREARKPHRLRSPRKRKRNWTVHAAARRGPSVSRAFQVQDWHAPGLSRRFCRCRRRRPSSPVPERLVGRPRVFLFNND